MAARARLAFAASGSPEPPVLGPLPLLGPPAPAATPAPSPAPESASDASATPAPDEQPPPSDEPDAAAPSDAEQPSPEDAVAEARQTEPDPAPRVAEPVHIVIPRLGVNARVVPLGYAPDGSMATPNNQFDVGWWEPGYRPGEYGSAVMGGHVDWAGYGAAVFWYLKLLRPGDTISVTSADGSVTTFTVTEVAVYAYNDTSAIDRIFRTAGERELNLITCTGTFDVRAHNYDHRLVVYSSAP